MILAHKFYEDDSFNYKTYSISSEIRKEDLILMEGVLLELIDYDLYISESEFNEYSKYICILTERNTEKLEKISQISQIN